MALPGALSAELQEEREDVLERKEAERIYREIARPPSPIFQICAVLFNGWAWLVLGAFYLTGAWVGCAYALFLICKLMHVHVYDVVSDDLYNASVAGGTIGLTVLVNVLGVYGRRKALSTVALQTALSARPPSRPGGPAGCRSCGAPLAVPTDALGVRCRYCGADNIVVVSATWLKQRVDTTQEVARRAGDASAALALEHRRLKRSALIIVAATLGVWFAMFGLSGLAALLSSPEPKPEPELQQLKQLNDGVAPPYADYVSAPTFLRRPAFAQGGFWGFYERLGACPPEAPLHIHRYECARGTCTVRLLAALRRADRLTLHSSTLPAGTRVRFVRHGLQFRDTWPTRPSEPFGPLEAQDTIGGTRTATFKAAWSSWYEIEFSIPESNAAKARLCLEVQR